MRILALALCMIIPAAAMPVMGWARDDLPTIAHASATGNSAWGMKVTLPTTSDLVVEVNVAGPQADSTVSAGAAVTDADGNPTFMFTFNIISSPDRNIGLPVEVGLAPAGMHLTYTSPENKGQPGTDEACTFVCIALESDGSAPGDYHYVAWVAGGGSGDVNVKANAGSAVFNTGTSKSAGDADFTNGNPDIQYQSGGVGFKLIKDASVAFAAPTRTYGVWYDLNLKLVCAAICDAPLLDLAGACTFASVDCGTGLISLDGPDGHQAPGYFITLLNASPGDYKFNSDSKVEAYSSGAQPFTCVLVACGGALLLEDFSILSVASVAVPS
jgi:hypothetical protein